MIPILDNIVLIYGFIALTHLFFQINLAHIKYIKHHGDKLDPKFTPKAVIIVPCYNEDYDELKICVESALHQNYPNCKVILVDDGSKDKSISKRIANEHKKNSKFLYHCAKRNKGKREAQKIAFDKFENKVDIYITIDSDTILDPDSVLNLVQKFKNPKVGAVTGNIRAIRNRGFLTRLIDGRYFSAFNQERAAQSLFGMVLCCSGPFSAYRSSVINKVKDTFVSQRFLGKKCTYGDDRHLTNLVLNEGYKVYYEYKAHAITHVPNKFPQFFKQQVRWNKSFYRELIWTIKFYIKNPKNFHPYILYDLTIQTVLPFLLITSLAYCVYRSITYSPVYLLKYMVLLFGIACLRTSYAFMRSRDKNLLLFPIYSVIHIFLLIPARLYALATLRKTNWGTR